MYDSAQAFDEDDGEGDDDGDGGADSDDEDDDVCGDRFLSSIKARLFSITSYHFFHHIFCSPKSFSIFFFYR